MKPEDPPVEHIFTCPECRVPMRPEDGAGTLACPKCRFSLTEEKGIWHNPALPGFQPGNYCGNIDYTSRLADPYSTTGRETPYYCAFLERVVETLGQGSVSLDLGCGDGRFTKHLLALGLDRIFAVDLDLSNLQRLSSRLTEEERQRTVLLQADARRVPLAPASLDAVFAMGVLNVLVDQIEPVCRHLCALLKPEGTLVNSDPTLEGSLLYALVRHDFEEFLEVARTHTKTVDYDGDRSRRYAVFEQGKMESVLSSCGFDLHETRGIPVLPSLIFGGVLQMQEWDDETKKALVRTVEELAGRNVPVYRVRLYWSRKKAEGR